MQTQGDSFKVRIVPNESFRLMACPGCAGMFPDIEGSIHPYIGASAGCWEVYGKILAREYGEFMYPPIHRLTVDTYAVQHPGVASRKSAQSVWVHISALYLILEKSLAYEAVTDKLGSILSANQEFEWLEPPPNQGGITVLDVENAKDLKDHTQRVKRWAESVWKAWSPHHAAVARRVGKSF